jgi:hydrogenase maturation protease
MLRRLPVKLSPHQVGVQEMLLVSELRGRCPREVALWGVIPRALQPGCELSPLLQSRVGEIAGELVAELQRSGIHVVSV